MLVVIAVIAILAGLVLPSMSSARDRSRTLVCLTHLRELGAGWQIYADQNDSAIVPARMYEKDGGTSNHENFYDVGNGRKYRPRWIAALGAQVGVFAFNQPTGFDPPTKDGISPSYDRQDYDNDVYTCPIVSHWRDEQNHSYGYNYQFLGNARQTNDEFHNFPIKTHRIKKPGGTVMAADSIGTAAGFPMFERGEYDKLSDTYERNGNHGYTLDPPRLTDECDRGTEDLDSPRTAVDPRHRGKVNAVFTDNHGATMTSYELGYRRNRSGQFVDEVVPGSDGGDSPWPEQTRRVDPDGSTKKFYTAFFLEDGEAVDKAHNRLFSGTGLDTDPPPIPLPSGN